MKKIIITAVVLLSTFGTVGSSYAFNWDAIFNKAFFDAVAAYQYNKSKIATPGDAFDPNATGVVSVAELRTICLDLGGTPSRKFQGDDFHFYCAQ